MSGTRPSIIDRIRQAFENREVKKRCITSSRENIQRNYTNRAFDQFPILISPQELAEHSQTFNKLLEKIVPLLDQDEDPINLSPEDQAAILEWQMQLVTKGCEDLIADSRVKDELIYLLHWRDLRTKLDIAHIVGSFVGAVNQYITEQCLKDKELSESQQIACGAICNYINKNYYHWIINKLHELGHCYSTPNNSSKPRSALSSFSQTVKDHQADILVGASAVGAAGVLAALGAIGFAMFASRGSRSNTPTPATKPTVHRQ